MQLIKLQNTPAERDYLGSGKAILITNLAERPEKLVYIENESINTEGDIDVKFLLKSVYIDANTVYQDGGHVYYGMCSCYEFNVFNKLI